MVWWYNFDDGKINFKIKGVFFLDRLLYKINFQISKMKIYGDFDSISVVLDDYLKDVFLNNVDYFLSKVIEKVYCKKVSYDIVFDFADREILFFNFFY